MDESHRTNIALSLAAPTAGCLLVAWIVVGCRVPEPPVLKRESSVILYDTAKEAELRSGKPLRFGLDGMDRYIDTLAEPVAITEWSPNHCKWEVFVATNRGRLESPDDPEAANRVLDVVHYGRCEVTLPRNDVGLRMEEEEKRKNSPSPPAPLPEEPGRGETGKQKKSISASSSAVVAASAKNASAASDAASGKPVGDVESARISEVAFLEGVSEQVRRSRQQDLLVFVHGFNVSFEAAVARTAQVALKIPFNGAVVSYCWPTQCGVFNYSDDEPINKASVAPFTQFLFTLRQGVPPETRIHIMVHSMGNRIVMESLSKLPTPRGTKPFGHVVLCAPDVGHDDFRKWAPGVVKQAERVTLYANAGDSALIVSKSLHAEKRAGDAFVPMVVPGVDTIDCSPIEESLMGHSYYGDNRDVTTDLFMLIKEDLPPSKRQFLDKKKSADGAYWQFARHAPTIMCTWHFEE